MIFFSLYSSGLSFVMLAIESSAVIISGNPVALSLFCFRSIMWSRTLDKIHKWCSSVGSKHLKSLSVHIEFCPLEGYFMICSMLSLSKTPVQFTCRYLKDLHIDKPWRSFYIYIVYNSLVGYMATEAKCVQIVFKVFRLTISMKMSESAVPHNHLEAGHSRKHFHQR